MLSNKLVVLLIIFAVATTQDCSYSDYIQTYNKTYTLDEYTTRSKIFADNCAKIQAFNANSSEYKMGLNQFTDWFQMEKSAFTNASSTPGTVSSVPFIPKGTVSAAPSLDYKALGKITGIKNQQQCGSCWAFASTALYESLVLQNNFSQQNLADEAVLECTGPYNSRTAGDDCSGGYLSDPLVYLGGVGHVRTSKYPYIAGSTTSGKPTTPGICSDTARVFLGAGTPKTYNSQLTIAQIQTALATNGPMVVGFAVNNAFYSYSTGVFTSCTVGQSINHAMLLYGYDTNGNWLIKNQWGTTWGQSGYLTLSSTNDCGISSNLFFIDIPTVNSNVNQVV